MKQENAKNVEIPEFRIKFTKEEKDQDRSRSKLYEITDDSKMNVSITKSAANPSPSENIGMTRNSVKKIEKLNTVSAEELKSKLRSKSVSKAEVEEGDQQSLSQTKRNKFGKHSSSSLLKEKIGSSQNYFINNVKINANMSNKNIIQLEYDTKESIVKNPLLSDNPITMKVSEAKIVESWKDFDEISEPITPVKLTDTINKEFKTNNSNIVSFVSKKTKKKSPKKIVKEKHRSIPSRVEKIEEANEKNKQQKVIVSKKIQIKENLKVQVSQNKFKTLNDIKPPNTIK